MFLLIATSLGQDRVNRGRTLKWSATSRQFLGTSVGHDGIKYEMLEKCIQEFLGTFVGSDGINRKFLKN